MKSSRPVLSPGWDDAPIDRPGRARPRRWRRLRAGPAKTTRLAPGSCCGCGGAVCGGCPVPNTLTFSYTFGQVLGSGCPDFSSSITLTGPGTGINPLWTGTMSLPVCSSCGSCTGTNPAVQRVQLTCDVFGNISLGWPDYGGGCGYLVNGSGHVGTFQCTPFLWTISGLAGCPLLCALGASNCWCLNSATLSA